MTSPDIDNNKDFKLQKWYLDCVSEKGEAFIGYSAELKWKSLCLTYSSFLEFDGERSKTRTSLLKESLPKISKNTVSWKPKKLSFEGYWRNKGVNLPKLRLYEDKNGSVVWNPRFPLSDAKVICSDTGSKLNGSGYVEMLDLSLPPWKLLIEDLVWGHFLSESVYIVWIEWRGPNPLTLVYVNGEKVQNASISESGICWKEGSLHYRQSSVLREGYLVNTALKKIPGIKTILPKKIVNMSECKRLSSSEVTLNGTSHWGWAIHEIVQF